ncbi:acyl-CoA synthetase [Caballeronia sordidicola]|uniref:3-methylmercaptopropionyl-CoA ligase (DmdB) n=1 Tax=Caballeronia sordidicola TaxID=196367 RepID=A0A242MLK3_CABSO|nr:acyl-CoA synthetase [Caballeronia sordidicola]OTP72133.1 3-methylmercaptopropionyl-CoA ligase (DmdB) [Caballeronia sordidicola]
MKRERIPFERAFASQGEAGTEIENIFIKNKFNYSEVLIECFLKTTYRTETAVASINPYDFGLEKNSANYVPLSPISFIERAALVYPNHVAVIHGDLQFTWKQCYERCLRLASALKKRGVGVGDTVALMAPNVPAMYEAHFAVPMIGAVLNTLNLRLDAEAIGFMLQHGEAKVVITDREYSGIMAHALPMLEERPLVIDIDDPEYEGGKLLGEKDYEAFLLEGDANFEWSLPSDEWNAIALNYTSGTTGNPKGVVYHHRGAYLNAVSNILSLGMPQHAVYLWTLPMFHCNGWCFPWTMAANAGTNVCLRRVDAKAVFHAIKKYKVTHFCAAPIVHTMLINVPEEARSGIEHRVSGCIAGAAPPASVIEGMERIGFDITHVYGLTETYGPAAVCAKQNGWDELPLEQRAELNGRQGVRAPMQEDMVVMDPASMEPVPWDGETMGEIMFRGNLIMKGYLKNPHATEKEFAGGWFHSGDLAVVGPDGYVKIKDRSKDIIISGGENISSLEVEDVLYRHAAVVGAAVVARPDEKWGEVACAFVELRDDGQVTELELIDFCRERMARFKVPKKIIFGPLTRTGSGKIQKFLLREQAQAL